jgi:adenylate cyclase
VIRPDQITGIHSLLEALDDRGDTPDARQRFDDAVWKARGRKGAVLVTDLSGFTRLTKKHGILHFLSVFRRCEQLCLPLIPRFGGELMKHEADDLIVLFPEAVQAIACGLEMQRATQDVSAGLPPDERVEMCIGVEYGTLLRLTDDAFGDPVNVAFKLGEDVAQNGEVLIGPHAWAEATKAAYDWRPYVVDGPRVVEAGNVALEHWSVRIR